MIGQQLSPILDELENCILEHNAFKAVPPEYDDGAMRASLTIMMSVLMDKMWRLQEEENIPLNVRMDMAKQAGNEIRELVKKYTNIDTFDLFD
jgi:hypothetical protein